MVSIKVLHRHYSFLGTQEADCIRRLNQADVHHFSATLRLYVSLFLLHWHGCSLPERSARVMHLGLFVGLSVRTRNSKTVVPIDYMCLSLRGHWCLSCYNDIGVVITTLTPGEECEGNAFGSVCLSGHVTQKLSLQLT